MLSVSTLKYMLVSWKDNSYELETIQPEGLVLGCGSSNGDADNGITEEQCDQYVSPPGYPIPVD